jgi:hypothetical protein
MKHEPQEALLHKVDALIKKHRSAAAKRAMTIVDVPILTDVVANPEAQGAAAPPPDYNDNPALTEFAFDGLADELFTRILKHVDTRLATELNVHIKAEIERAIRENLPNLKRQVAKTVSKAIAEALSENLSNPATADGIRPPYEILDPQKERQR